MKRDPESFPEEIYYLMPTATAFGASPSFMPYRGQLSSGLATRGFSIPLSLTFWVPLPLQALAG